ncbi:DUF4221 family protein [Belliella pelovolcani]|uniref:TolB-like 6-blade propeller-like n=1 Tax=Belliella pelovolcani TaxID=529505 RepID=A0A1N7KMR5_9BACT|nr:DUF4221 family protein [Belliella pelovolcani]SIS62834.1 protein of unknown function [Belliella pelovolcani]
MKYFILPIAALLLISCGGNSDQSSAGNYADITISMDTVVVDSGDEILMAATNFYNQTLNQSADRLYFWNYRSHILEIVDLNEMVFLEKRRFEKEGPNGVGQFPNRIILIGEDKIGFVQWTQINIADMNGNLLKTISIDEDWMKGELNENESLIPYGFSDDGETLYCAIATPQRLNSNFIEVDLTNKKTKLIELTEFDKREKFRVTFTVEMNGGISTSTAPPSLDYTRHKDKLIFCTNVFNNIYQFDPKTNSLEYITISNSLTPNEKIKDYENDVNSEEAFFRIMNEIQEEVSFSNLLWDDVNHVFYRITSFNMPRIDQEKIKSKVFISIISEDFKVINEKEITDNVDGVPKAQFVKDGKIHAFLNVDDELGYVRIKVN